MSSFTTPLQNREEVASETIAITLLRPSGFEFTAGQSVAIRVPGSGQPLPPQETIRPFSIASPPSDRNHLVFAFRKGRSFFKHQLATLPLQSELEIRGPRGSFVLSDQNLLPVVFLAGGIGITPTRSMILEEIHKKSTRSLFLLYSNRRPEDTAFLEEFQKLFHPTFHFIGTMTGMKQSRVSWGGERGYITAEMIKKYCQDLSFPHYYLVGPPSFVDAMEEILRFSNVDAESIHVDKFFGY